MEEVVFDFWYWNLVSLAVAIDSASLRLMVMYRYVLLSRHSVGVGNHEARWGERLILSCGAKKKDRQKPRIKILERIASMSGLSIEEREDEEGDEMKQASTSSLVVLAVGDKRN